MLLIFDVLVLFYKIIDFIPLRSFRHGFKPFITFVTLFEGDKRSITVRVEHKVGVSIVRNAFVNAFTAHNTYMATRNTLKGSTLPELMQIFHNNVSLELRNIKS